MTSRIVVDASVLLAWALGEPETFDRAKVVLAQIAKERALVPAIWQAEVANVLVVKERQKRVTEPFVRKFLRHLEEIGIEVDVAAASQVFDRVLPLARRHQLSVYDACYLELAMREKATLATFDSALREAGRREGVAVFAGA